MKLKNKVCVVTGGAMGNGLGIVKVFLKYGAKVSIIDYDESVSAIVAKLNNEGYDVIGFHADIRDKYKVKEAIEKTKEIFGNIDVLVNNAGVAKIENFMDMSDEVRDFHFDVNIKGTWNVTKSCLKYFNDNGSIVNLSSVTGPMVADTGECAYATTKAALIGFTKGLAMELVSRNIRVNAIMPGYIMTPMVDGIAKDSNSEDPKSVIEGIRTGIPMKRLGTIEELGELAAFLASDEASYITGQGIVIDGGSTLPETMSVGV